MTKPSDLFPGFKAGHLTLRGRVRTPKHGPQWAKRKWLCDCVCGQRITVPEYYLVREPNPKTHCGCKVVKTNKTLFNQEYRIWCMMHQRCYSDKHVAWKHYGGRGISICERWHKDRPDGKGFENFLADVGKRPSPTHSIDRIDPDGHYELKHRVTGLLQVRWATPKEQGETTRWAVAKKAMTPKSS